MSKMFYSLPQDIEVAGKRYPINTDYRAWIEFESILEKRSGYIEKIPELIRAVMPIGKLPSDVAELLKKLFDFYRADITTEKKTTDKNIKKIYSFSYDFDYIYTAFLTQYGIDLSEEKVHWYKFITLFSGLSGEHKITEIIGYRAMDLSKETDKKRRAYYRKMKSIYALPDNRTPEEIESDMTSEIAKLF